MILSYTDIIDRKSKVRKIYKNNYTVWLSIHLKIFRLTIKKRIHHNGGAFVKLKSCTQKDPVSPLYLTLGFEDTQSDYFRLTYLKLFPPINVSTPQPFRCSLSFVGLDPCQSLGSGGDPEFTVHIPRH